MNYSEAMDNCIFRFVSGSHAYGTNIEGSDEDFRGVFIAPMKYAFDLFQTSFVSQGSLDDHLKSALESLEIGDYNAVKELLRLSRTVDAGDLNFSIGTVRKPGEDEELQELRKFLKLAAECNPNIIEFLYVDRLITHNSEIWELIRSHRDMFLSKRARYTFSGYAISQFRKIESHRRYLLKPPDHKPLRGEFDLPENTGISRELQNAILSLPNDMIRENLRQDVINERKYRDAMNDWVAYDRWSKERNPARREMEKKFGYDGKCSLHLVRLSRMAKEILTEKKINVFRPDWKELLAIRNGEWKFDQIVDLAQNIDSELDELYKTSTLRDKPDYKGIAKLYEEICKMRYGITF